MASFSGSPVMSSKTFSDATFRGSEDVMTVEGTIMRAILLLVVIIGAGYIPWSIFFSNSIVIGQEVIEGSFERIDGTIRIFMWGGLIGGLILSLIIIFKKTLTPYLALPYAFCEGLALGAISALFEAVFSGIVFQAISSTFVVFFVMLLLYRLRIIKPTKRFHAILTSCIIGIGIVYLINIIWGFFGGQIPGLFGNGGIGIGFSAIVCIVASLSLIMDFKLIEDGVNRRAPKYMSWYGAFAMMVTLVWLYLEILRLLAKIRSSD